MFSAVSRYSSVIRVGEFDNAPLLGSAMLAAVGAGAFNGVNDDNDDDDQETRASSSTSTSSVVTGTGTGTRASSKAIKSSGKESQEQGTISDRVGSLVLLRRLQRAAKAMVRERLRVEPDAGRKARYDRVLLCHCVLSETQSCVDVLWLKYTPYLIIMLFIYIIFCHITMVSFVVVVLC